MDGVDFDAIKRIARYRAPPAVTKDRSDFGLALGLSVVKHLEHGRATNRPADLSVRLALIDEAMKPKQ
jgi:hypothetical protein